MQYIRRLTDRTGKKARDRRAVHLVYDLGGAGRVVGVFSEAARAQAIVALNPAYFRTTIVHLDEVTPEAIAWATAPLAAALRSS